MTKTRSASVARPHLDHRATLALGAGVALTLGVLRGVAQMVAREVYSYPMRMIAIMALTSAIWVVVPPLIAYVLRAEFSRKKQCTLLTTLAFAFSAIEPLWFYGALVRIAGFRERGGYWINGLLRLDTNLLIFGAIVGWLWLREVNRRRNLAAEHAAHLRMRASDAELDVLTMQLQPHFLFNTLNLVSQLAYENATRARRAIGNLRKLLVESVASSGGATVTLAEELRLLEAYLELQRDRFGERLDARVVADVNLFEARVPRMLLQPIVENAIRHGIAPRKSGGSVHVRIRRGFGSRVSIDVSDDGIGVQTDAHDGMGLANVRHRLEQLYPGDVRVELNGRDDGGATTRLDFPFETRQVLSPADGVVDAQSNDEQTESVYNVSRPLRAAAMIGGWILIAAIWSEMEAITMLASQQVVPWSEILGRYGLNAMVWIALTPLAMHLSRRFATSTIGRRVAMHTAGAALFAAAHLWLWGVLMRVIMHSREATIASFRNSWAVWDVVAYAVIVAIGETAAAQARLREQRMEATRESTRLAAARVAMLRLHLQPSLLLTAVDAVEESIGNPMRCETTITRLGDVLRALLATSALEEVALDDELGLLENYAAVVARPMSIVVADPADRSALLPSTILCSLVASSRGGALDVGVSRRGRRLTIALSTAGDLALGGDVLTMTERRLSTLYKADHAVRLVRDEERCSILLELPLRHADSQDERRAVVERLAIA